MTRPLHELPTDVYKRVMSVDKTSAIISFYIKRNIVFVKNILYNVFWKYEQHCHDNYSFKTIFYQVYLIPKY